MRTNEVNVRPILFCERELNGQADNSGRISEPLRDFDGLPHLAFAEDKNGEHIGPRLQTFEAERSVALNADGSLGQRFNRTKVYKRPDGLRRDDAMEIERPNRYRQGEHASRNHREGTPHEGRVALGGVERKGESCVRQTRSSRILHVRLSLSSPCM